MRQIKLFFVSFLMAMTLFAFVDGKALADETAVNPNLYGPWELMVLENGRMTIRLTLIIKTGEVIASNTCSFQEYSVQAEVSSSAVITPGQIHKHHALYPRNHTFF